MSGVVDLESAFTSNQQGISPLGRWATGQHRSSLVWWEENTSLPGRAARLSSGKGLFDTFAGGWDVGPTGSQIFSLKGQTPCADTYSSDEHPGDSCMHVLPSLALLGLSIRNPGITVQL